MVFQAKHDQKEKQIENLAHVGAMILGHSRAIIYYQIFIFYKYIKPSMGENLYIDTDSMMWALGDIDFKNCIKPELLSEFEKVTADMFVDPEAEKTQAGKLKLEGFYKSGFFKCVKNYTLIPFEEPVVGTKKLKKVVKSKGMPKKVRAHMTEDFFKTNSFVSEKLFFQNFKLHPTVGSEQMIISLQKRKMTNALNCKRKLVYNHDTDCPTPVSIF